jgi:hypothetical protein
LQKKLLVPEGDHDVTRSSITRKFNYAGGVSKNSYMGSHQPTPTHRLAQLAPVASGGFCASSPIGSICIRLFGHQIMSQIDRLPPSSTIQGSLRPSTPTGGKGARLDDVSKTHYHAASLPLSTWATRSESPSIPSSTRTSIYLYSFPSLSQPTINQCCGQAHNRI